MSPGWFGSDNEGPVYIYYKEVVEEELEEHSVDSDDRKEKFKELLTGFDRQMKSHSIDELDMNANPENWIRGMLDEYPDIRTRDAQSLINNFSDELMTRAREKGKYALLIIVPDAIYICHTDADEKSITTEMQVINRLLDIDNVDKLIQFKSVEEGIEVNHFERHRTKSLADWLGLPQGHIAYGDAGDIKIYTEIEDTTVAFEFDRNEFENRFLLDRDYEIRGDTLITPSGDTKVIEQIKLGRSIYENPREFKQEFFTLYYDLNTYREKYSEIMGSVDPYEKRIIDYEEELSTPSGSRYITKENQDFKILFCNENIELAESFKQRLLERHYNDNRTMLYHSGGEFSDDALVLGSWEVHNEGYDIETGVVEHLNDLERLARETYSGEPLRYVLYYIIYTISAENFEGPVDEFFEIMAEYTLTKMDVDGDFIQDENGVLEYKSLEWFSDEDDEDIAEKIIEETQNSSKLLIGGVEEDVQSMRPLSGNRFDSERNERIRDEIQDREDDIEHLKVDSMPLGDGDCLLLVSVSRTDTENNLEHLFGDNDA